MSFIPFELERWQSIWENRVRYNLSESGVHPLSSRELLAISGGSLEELADVRMVYSQANGTEPLRREIAALYPGATIDNILVTLGSAEANFIICWGLLERGSRIAVMVPNYLQTLLLARNFGAETATYSCTMDRNWEPNPDELARVISPGTRLVVVTNPNNPSGRAMSAAMRQEIVERARAAGAWLLADEVYQGAERSGPPTPSFWGSYDKLIVTNGLSKAYGLPGLRIGWIVAPAELIDALWARHDYTAIGPSPVSDYLAIHALRVRPKILARTRAILNQNYPVLDAWLREGNGMFQWREPDAGAICCARFTRPVNTLDLAERIRVDKSLLIVPGEHFGMPGHIRIGYGEDPGIFSEALGVLREGLTTID
jgi:aspartate/methionine/tyrosine aminotransferase